MKPSFALNFTDDGIQLLHRAGKGWTLVGETPFAAPDLDDALDYLRKTALGLEPGGFATKLVIPNAQIRYLEIEAPGPGDDARRQQIATALEATTPLKADEIAFDWSGKGKTVKVAALDKTTLAEAEGFAVAHRFNPVGFVAIPEDGAFSGEPWFGETSAAAAITKGAPVERDRSAIRILERELPGAPAAASLAMAPEEGAAAASVGSAAALSDPPSPDPVPEPGPRPPEEIPLPPPSEPAPAEPEMPVPGDPTPEPEPAPDLPDEIPPAPPEELAAEEAAEAPFTHVAENPAFPEDEPEFPAPRPTTPQPTPAAVAETALGPIEDPSVSDDLPPAPSPAAMVAFASRRSADPVAPPLGAATRPDASALARAARGKPVEDLPPMPRPPQAGARPAAVTGLRAGMGKGLGALVTSPTLPGTRKAKAKTMPPQPPVSPAARVQSAAAIPTEAAKSLTRPGGTFGARPATQSKSRTVLFLSLVAILLLCLALIAAWSSFYLASRDDPAGEPVATAASSGEGAAGEATSELAETTEQDVPAIEDEMLADGEVPLDGTELAAGDEALPDPEAAEDVAAAVVPPAEDVALADVPAPGVPSDSPETQSQPQQQDEIFLAAADAPPPALDALSLPAPDDAADVLPAPQMPPPPFGTVYAFDANGLLIPTPEGIVSPEGVLLIAGKPPLVPPSRSPAATEAALAAAAAAAAVSSAGTPAADDATATAEPALIEALPVGAAEAAPGTGEAAVPVVAEPALQPNPDLADRRPKARPEGLATSPDDAALAVEPEVSFASLRPRERPQIILAASERARQETAAASLAAPPADAPADTAEAEAALAAAAAAEAANPSVVAISRRPAARPNDFSAAVEAAVAAAIRAPEPKPEPEPEPAPKKSAKKEPAPDIKPEEQDEIDEPEVASGPAPKIPTKASVAKQATFKNAINLSKINLIGVYGTQSKRYALIRQANGKYKKVKVGDRIDGGRVEAITQSEVRYQKGGRLISLKMPKG